MNGFVLQGQIYLSLPKFKNLFPQLINLLSRYSKPWLGCTNLIYFKRSHNLLERGEHTNTSLQFTETS